MWVQSASQGVDAPLQCTFSALVQVRRYMMRDPGSNIANPAAARPEAGAHQPEAAGDLQRDARAPEHAELARGRLPQAAAPGHRQQRARQAQQEPQPCRRRTAGSECRQQRTANALEGA